MEDQNPIPVHNTMTNVKDNVEEAVSSTVSKVGSWVKNRYNKSSAKEYFQAKTAPPQIDNSQALKNMGLKSMSELTTHGYSKNKRDAEYAEARQLKDPSQAKTPALQLQAASAKMSRLEEDVEYKGLSPYYQNRVKQAYYEKYTMPALLNNGLKASPWVDQPVREELPGKPKAGLNVEFGKELMAGYAGTIKAAAGVLRYAIKDSSFAPDAKVPGFTKALVNTVNHMQDYADSVKGVSTGLYDTFEDQHTIMGWAANFAGRMIGEAPAYIMAGEGLGALGKVVARGSEILSGVTQGVVPSLAEKAALSKGFKFAVEGLKAASEVFTVDKAEGESGKTSSTDAIAAGILGPTLGAALHGLGGMFSKIAGTESSRLSIIDHLRWGAAKSAIGGEAFVNSVSNAADEAIGEKGAEILLSSVHPEDPIFQQSVKAEMAAREELTKALYGDDAFNERKQLEFARRGMETLRAQGIPIPKTQTYRDLSISRKQRIKEMMKAMSQQAQELMPLVNPEAQTVANGLDIHKWLVENPAAKGLLEHLEQSSGLKAEIALTKGQASNLAEQHGLVGPTQTLTEMHAEPNSQLAEAEKIVRNFGSATPSLLQRRLKLGYNAAESLLQQLEDTGVLGPKEGSLPRKLVVATTDTSEYEPKDGAFASLGDGYKVNYMANRAAPISTLLKPSLPIQNFIEGTIQYMPDSKYRSSGKFEFEHPEHYLLYLRKFSAAPPAIKGRATKILQQETGLSLDRLNTKSGWVNEHYKDVAFNEPNLKQKGVMYKSTPITQRRYSTSVAKELYSNDTEATIRKQLSSIYKKQPELRKIFKPLWQDLNALRNKSATPETTAKRRELMMDLKNLIQRIK